MVREPAQPRAARTPARRDARRAEEAASLALGEADRRLGTIGRVAVLISGHGIMRSASQAVALVAAGHGAG
jgi:hypothetical protein